MQSSGPPRDRGRGSALLQGRGEPRWVERSILDDLEAQMGNRDIVLRFALNYTQLWAQQQHSLTAAIERQDHRAALDAVLSLKNSSAMVGGIRLARLAETLEMAIREGLDSGRSSSKR